ncbi:hypothetical protein EG68_03876 [Paragonimus skrjabini miyazakii]|uniref:V-type proton ATPase subunit S1/VOA1 transmembrane domain-containing protein n=1 Tax=Paragonimus skrjabini miyazakii TaxID=59628 RepID=A0A8S9YVB7_9TREM|nr:hypothetical protein EG68_03876 [Paragonimus skrjabini miyazakii]
MSFKCTSPPLVTLVSSTVNPPPLALRFTWLQVQPLGASGGRFSAATDCTGFFTIGIWSTLIVSFLLIGILTYGLQMLMSIKPNELYDDPKVKMVQLGALN